MKTIIGIPDTIQMHVDGGFKTTTIIVSAARDKKSGAREVASVTYSNTSQPVSEARAMHKSGGKYSEDGYLAVVVKSVPEDELSLKVRLYHAEFFSPISDYYFLDVLLVSEDGNRFVSAICKDTECCPDNGKQVFKLQEKQ